MYVYTVHCTLYTAALVCILRWLHIHVHGSTYTYMYTAALVWYLKMAPAGAPVVAARPSLTDCFVSHHPPTISVICQVQVKVIHLDHLDTQLCCHHVAAFCLHVDQISATSIQL